MKNDPNLNKRKESEDNICKRHSREIKEFIRNYVRE